MQVSVEQFDEGIFVIPRSWLSSLLSTDISFAFLHAFVIKRNIRRIAPVQNAMLKKSRNFRKFSAVPCLAEQLGILAKYFSMFGVATSLMIFSVA